MPITTAGGAGGGGVDGYWMIKNTTTGHTVLARLAGSSPFQLPDITTAVRNALGKGQYQSYYLGGAQQNLPGEIEKALAFLQVSTDQPPVAASSSQSDLNAAYGALFKNGLQAINFDILVPTGVNPNKYQQATSQAGSTAAGLVNLLSAKGIEAFAVRVLEALVAVGLLFLGLQALTGTGSGSPVELVTKTAKTAAKAAAA